MIEVRSRSEGAISRHPRYRALASDGDGTLTVGGRMAKRTARALERLKEAGYQLLLVTGETREDLAEFPRTDLFDHFVLENGAVLFDPTTAHEEALHEAPPPELVRALRRKGVDPLKVGRVMLSTEKNQEKAVSAVLADLGLDWRVVHNRKDVMVLPAGVSKATGLADALKAMRLPARQVVGVGDAENDVALLEFCGLGVAVANAVPLLKGRAGRVTTRGAGAGVVELIEWLLEAVPAQAG